MCGANALSPADAASGSMLAEESIKLSYLFILRISRPGLAGLLPVASYVVQDEIVEYAIRSITISAREYT